MISTHITIDILVNSKTAKGQSFYRRLTRRQKSIMHGFSCTRLSCLAR